MKLEKIYVILKSIFMYFQARGYLLHISNGCIPYTIIISFEKKIGLKYIKDIIKEIIEKSEQKIIFLYKIISPPF